MNNFIVLGIVFVAVIVCVVVFLPVFVPRKQENKETENNFEVVDDPIRRFIDPDELQKMRYSASLIVGVISLAVMIALNFYWGVVIVILLAAAAYQLPWLVIQRKIAKRNAEFETGMLDFTILITNSLRAGIALPSAIEMSIQTVGGAIREEFTVVLREHHLGIDLAESIERLTKRIDSENLQLFSSTVCVTMRTGGSMADVLDHVVATIRQRSAFQDKLKTMIAQSQFEAFAISMSPFVAFIVLYLLDRKLMMPMLTTPIGWLSIFAIIVLETIGFFVLKHVTRVKF